MNEKVEQLLHQVKIIDDAYRIVKKNTGEDFNLFQILGIETAEVKTHSKFLAELLNPKGSHLQGDIFLKLFINYLNNVNVESENVLIDENNKIILNSEKSNIEIEKHIGKVNENEGGRIDIAIIDSENNLIAIENKIYAGEQDKQLLRYLNFGSKFSKFHLLFLTLDGGESSTLKKEDGIYYSVSYKKHIIEWLELCKKEAVNLPILRETIGQYINLIKKLTNQTTNFKMAEDIQKIILNNLEESKLIADNYNKSILIFCNEILEEVKRNLDFVENAGWTISRYDEILINDYTKNGAFYITPKNYNGNDWMMGMEGFNPIRTGNKYFDKRISYGVWGKEGIRDYYDNFLTDEKKSLSAGWWNDYKILEYNGLECNLSDSKLVNQIINEHEYKKFINHIVGRFKDYFFEHKDLFEKMIYQSSF